MAFLNFSETALKKKIYDAMVVQINADLTNGRQDEELTPYSKKECEMFIRKMNSTIYSAVDKMYKAYKDDGDLDELENPEDDWYREFLYEEFDDGYYLQ